MGSSTPSTAPHADFAGLHTIYRAKRRLACAWQTIKKARFCSNSELQPERAEFQRRYAMYPEIKKADVIVGSPVHAQHSEPHDGFRRTSRHLPLAHAWPAPGRQSIVQMTEEGLYIGAPDFVVEIAASSSANDLHSKLNVYRRNGVQEYLVLLAYERETRFFRLADGEYDAVEPDADGVLRSQVLPGFRFRSDWFWEGRMKELLQLVQEGIASPEHEVLGQPSTVVRAYSARLFLESFRLIENQTS